MTEAIGLYEKCVAHKSLEHLETLLTWFYESRGELLARQPATVNEAIKDYDRAIAIHTKWSKKEGYEESSKAYIEKLQKLKDKGMVVYQPTPADMAQYRELAQPAALSYLKGQVGQEWVDRALAAAKKGEQEVGDKADQIVKDHMKLANDKYAEWVKK